MSNGTTESKQKKRLDPLARIMLFAEHNAIAEQLRSEGGNDWKLVSILMLNYVYYRRRSLALEMIEELDLKRPLLSFLKGERFVVHPEDRQAFEEFFGSDLFCEFFGNAD